MRHTTRIGLFAIAAFPFIVAACGSDDSGNDNGGQPGVDGGGGHDGGPSTGNDGGGSGGGDSGTPVVIPTACNGSVLSTITDTTAPTAPNAALKVISGFTMEVIAHIDSARELAALPNGDLLVGTNGSSVYIIPNAEADTAPGKAQKFAAAPDSNPAGVAYSPTTCTIYLGTNKGVYSASYKDGDLTGTFAQIGKVRQGNPTPGSDGDVHQTTSVSVGNGVLYAGVGSGCNACTEVDPTRATIQQFGLDGSNMQTKAARIRNAIAMTTNPVTGTIWAGGAGQDSLALGHPYEFFDAVTSHTGEADYGWPDCEENHHQYGGSSDCTKAVQPLIEFPAYSTLIGASFYPLNPTGAHAFGAAYEGGLFVAGHGSWHTNGDGTLYSAPRLAFVAMSGDTPKIAVDWTDPTKQWTPFVNGWQDPNGHDRYGRPTGVAVGSKGSLFVGDDQNGVVYRIRPM